MPPKCRRWGRQRTTLRLLLHRALRQPLRLAAACSGPPHAGKPVSKATSLAKVSPADPTPCLGYYPSPCPQEPGAQGCQPSQASQNFHAGQALCFAGVSEVRISSTVPCCWVTLKKINQQRGPFILMAFNIPQVPKEKYFLSALVVFFFHCVQQ